MQDIKVTLPLGTSFLDYADNESLAVIVYVMGCDHGCSGCHNQQFSDFNYSASYTVNFDKLSSILKESTKKHRTKKVVIGGGDPLHPKNIEFVKYVLNKLTEYQFMVYTGYDVDYVKKNKVKGFTLLKCGRYEEDKKQKSVKTDSKFCLASKNQKIYDCNYRLLSSDGTLFFIN